MHRNMSKAIFLALLAAGMILIIYGISESDSLGSDISRFFTRSPTDKTIWLLIGGIAAAVVGARGLIRGRDSF